MKLELTINGISLKAYLSFFPLSHFTVFFMLCFILHSLRSVGFFYFRNYLSLQVGIHVSQLLSKPRHKLVHFSILLMNSH